MCNHVLTLWERDDWLNYIRSIICDLYRTSARHTLNHLVLQMYNYAVAVSYTGEGTAGVECLKNRFNNDDVKQYVELMHNYCEDAMSAPYKCAEGDNVLALFNHSCLYDFISEVFDEDLNLLLSVIRSTVNCYI